MNKPTLGLIEYTNQHKRPPFCKRNRFKCYRHYFITCKRCTQEHTDTMVK